MIVDGRRERDTEFEVTVLDSRYKTEKSRVSNTPSAKAGAATSINRMSQAPQIFDQILPTPPMTCVTAMTHEAISGSPRTDDLPEFYSRAVSNIYMGSSTDLSSSSQRI